MITLGSFFYARMKDKKYNFNKTLIVLLGFYLQTLTRVKYLKNVYANCLERKNSKTQGNKAPKQKNLIQSSNNHSTEIISKII